MTKFPLAIVWVVIFFNCAGLPPATALDKETENIVTVPLSKAEIYNKTLQWMATAFRSSKPVIEIKDSVQGAIVGKGIVSVLWQTITFQVHFTLKIDIKDKEYRFNGSNYILYWHDQISNSDSMSKELALKIRDKINEMEKSHYFYLTKKNKSGDFFNDMGPDSKIN
jgi:hypothetical protein